MSFTKINHRWLTVEYRMSSNHPLETGAKYLEQIVRAFDDKYNLELKIEFSYVLYSLYLNL
jgi:hypothetical protein